MDDITNLIRREVARQLISHGRVMVGVIDGYDPNEHASKVKFETEVDDDGKPRTSGFLRHTTAAGGAAASIAIGPSVGDQALVVHAENDPEGGHIIGFVHNDVDRPPVVKAGELLFTAKNGAQVHVDADGVATIKGAGGSTTVHDASGNITHTDSAGGVVYQSGGNVYLGSKTASSPVMLQSGAATKIMGI